MRFSVQMELSLPGNDEEHLLLPFELPLGRATRAEANQPLLQPLTAVGGVEGDPNARGVAVVRTCKQLGIGARSGDRFGYRKFKETPQGEVRITIAAGLLIAAKVVTEAGVKLD
jgi:hypothetical protein